MTSLHRQTAWSGRTSRYRWTLKSDQQPALNNQFRTSTNSEQPTLNIIQLWTINSDYQPTLNSVPRGWVRRSRKGKGRNGRQSWGLLLEEYSSDNIRGLIFWLEDSCSNDDFRKKKYPDRKTEEEILTLRQVLTAKERHAAGKIDNWPHTNLKILYHNDKHTISVERFCKT